MRNIVTVRIASDVVFLSFLLSPPTHDTHDTRHTYIDNRTRADTGRSSISISGERRYTLYLLYLHTYISAQMFMCGIEIEDGIDCVGVGVGEGPPLDAGWMDGWRSHGGVMGNHSALMGK